MKPSVHRILIPSILEVGSQTLLQIGPLLEKFGFSNVVIFFGEGIYKLFGEKTISSINNTSKINILKQFETDDYNLQSIINLAFTLPSDTDAVIGMGGGKVLDIAKYISFLNNLPFISIPTTISHDGFASSGCSLLIDSKRVSVPAKTPFGIIVDIDVIKSSPVKFIYSGIGDLVSKITAIYDWEFEELNKKTIVDAFAVMIAKKSVNSVVRMPYTSINEYWFLKELIDSLTMSGISMEIAGSSAPASGSEHLISHALDKILETPQLHGVQVGIATYLMSRVQNHRFERVRAFLSDTGFFEFVKQLRMKKEDFERAIDIAPTIKPNRYTYIHLQENQALAKSLLNEDEVLKEILI
jgi:glycerol-1-phosphate dehydrogenase [NAD(P)+]